MAITRGGDRCSEILLGAILCSFIISSIYMIRLYARRDRCSNNYGDDRDSLLLDGRCKVCRKIVPAQKRDILAKPHSEHSR